MADILFVTWDGGGNVPPALGIAAELSRRGTPRPVPRARPPGAPQISAAGFAFTAYESALPVHLPRGRTRPSVMVAIFGEPGMGADVVGRRVAAAGRRGRRRLHAARRAQAAAAVGRAALRRRSSTSSTTYYERLCLRGPLGLLPAAAPATRRAESLDAARLDLVASHRRASTRPPGPGRPPRPHRAGGRRRHAASCAVATPTVLVSLSTYGYPGHAEACSSTSSTPPPGSTPGSS